MLPPQQNPMGQMPAGMPGMAPSAPQPAQAPAVPTIDDTPIPMSAEELADWWSRVELAEQARGDREKRWQQLLEAYLPAVDPEAINGNTHFRNTEQKKDALFFQTPDLILTPLMPLQDQQQGPDGQVHTAEDVVSIKQAVLKKLLGNDGVDLKWLADEVLFEILQVSGLGPTLIAYECDKVDVPDEMTGQVTPVPIHEEWTWKKFSSKKLLIPHDWRSTRYDDSPWLGYQGVMPLVMAKRQKLVPEDFEPNATRDQRVFDPGKQSTRDAKGTSDLLEFTAIWYRPAFFTADVPHRQVFRYLVLVKGLEQPAKHVKSPYQTLGPDGKLTPDSMVGNPIHVFTLRDLSDSAYVPSDAAMTDPLVRQENVWASQDIKMRDANIPRFLYDERVKEALEKLASGDVGEGAGVDSAVLAQGIDKIIAQLPRLEKAMSDIQGRNAITQKINETLALGPNQSGTLNDKVLSATEISTAQATANIRLSAEQTRFMSQVLVGVRKFDALVQRFATETDYVTWVGRDGQRKLAAWNQTLIAGRYAYEVRPDSQLKIDQAQKRQQDIQFTNLMANAPETNRAELLRDLARDFGKDPSKLVQPPPQKQPDQPKLNLTVSAADFVGPQAPAAAEFLRIAGTPMSPQALEACGIFGQLYAQMQAEAQAAQQAQAPQGQPETEHGGALEGSGDFHPVSKHAGDITGQPAGRKPF